MPFDDAVSAYPVPATGTRLMSAYSRAVGGIQVLYASFFGWIAFHCLRWTVEQMSWIARDGFSFKRKIAKGEYMEPLDLSNLAEGTMTALLFVFGFIGACGLIGLRSWARRWEIAYFLFASVYALALIIVENRGGRDLGYVVHFYTILALPLLPFLFISRPPYQFPLVGKVKKSKPVLDD